MQHNHQYTERRTSDVGVASAAIRSERKRKKTSSSDDQEGSEIEYLHTNSGGPSIGTSITVSNAAAPPSGHVAEHHQQLSEGKSAGTAIALLDGEDDHPDRTQNPGLRRGAGTVACGRALNVTGTLFMPKPKKRKKLS